MPRTHFKAFPHTILDCQMFPLVREMRVNQYMRKCTYSCNLSETTAGPTYKTGLLFDSLNVRVYDVCSAVPLYSPFKALK